MLIVHQCSAPRQWHEEDIQLLHQLSIHLAIALQQAELYQNLESLNSSLEEKVQERTQEIQLQAQMLEQIHDAVISTTPDGTILTWNIGSERLYGYDSNEAIGQNISMLYLKEDLPLLQSSVFIPLFKKGTHEVELRIQTKSGNILYVNLRLSLVRDAMGNPIRLIGCSNNISDRKRAEQELQQLNQELEGRVEQRTALLKESEQRFASLAAAAPVAIFRINRDNECIYVNEFWTRITGQVSSVALGYGWIETIHPDDREQIHQQWTQAIDQQAPYQGEGRCVRPDGTISFYYCQALPEIDEEGNFIGYIGTLTDISDRKQAEIALIESEGKFRRLVEGGNDLIWSTDKNAAFTYLSPQFPTLFGLEVNEWIGKTFTDLVHPDDLDRLISAYLQSVRSQQKASNIEFRHLHQNGDYIWVSINTTPIINSEGIVIGGQGILTDISDRKLAERELQSLSNRLELALRSAEIGCWEWDIVNNIKVWDARMYEIYGLLEQDINSINYYERWTNILHPDDLLPTTNLLQQAILGQAEYDTEFRVLHSDGSIRFVKAYGILVRDAEGNPQKMIGINFDISDRGTGIV